MRFRLPKRTILLWQLRMAPAVVLLFLAALFFKSIALWIYILLLATTLVIILFTLIFLPLIIKSYEISADRYAITVRRGVIIKTVNVMPYPKTVFVRSIKTPLSSKMGLCAVSVKAVRRSLFIPEMRKDDAEMLLSRIWEEVG